MHAPEFDVADMSMAQGKRLRFQVIQRDLERFPVEDEALGERLFERLVGAIKKGVPRPSMLLFRPQQVDHIDLVPLLQSPRRESQRLMAALASQPGVECVAVLGYLASRQGASRGRAAVCFLEWPDNRWWLSYLPVAPAGTTMPAPPTVVRAIDGAPRPTHLGGWFSLGRRHSLKLRIRTATEPVVH